MVVWAVIYRVRVVKDSNYVRYERRAAWGSAEHGLGYVKLY